MNLMLVALGVHGESMHRMCNRVMGCHHVLIMPHRFKVGALNNRSATNAPRPIKSKSGKPAPHPHAADPSGASSTPRTSGPAAPGHGAAVIALAFRLVGIVS
jgi:hypothetical protein